MSATRGSSRYEIRIEGHLTSRWAARFDGMSLSVRDDGITVIEGPVVDQAALHGLLNRLADLGLPLLSVTRLDPATSDRSTTEARQRPRRPT